MHIRETEIEGESEKEHSYSSKFQKCIVNLLRIIIKSSSMRN